MVASISSWSQVSDSARGEEDILKALIASGPITIGINADPMQDYVSGIDNPRHCSGAVLDHAVVLPDVVVNRSARLRNCVIDRNVVIPTGLVVGEDPTEDAKYFRVTEKGTTLITQPMVNKWEAAQ